MSSKTLKESIKDAKQAYQDSIQYEMSCTFTDVINTVTTNEERYVNDISMEYASVIETYKNDAYKSSTVYSFEVVKHDTINETLYTTSNLKNDVVLSVGDKDTLQQYSYNFFGKPESSQTPILGYSGEVHDGSLQYLRARYYDTETGVFISKDTYQGTAEDIGSQNRYSYVQNNNANGIDPSGHFFKNLFKAIGNFVKKAVNSLVSFVKKVTSGKSTIPEKKKPWTPSLSSVYITWL